MNHGNHPIGMRGLLLRASALALVVLTAGCANAYLDAKRNTAPGGAQDRALRSAEQRAADATNRRTSLEDQKLQRERDIERQGRAIQALESQLAQQDRQLNAALRARKISKTEHDRLRRDLDNLRADTRQAELENQSSAFAGKGVDPKKEARLRELEQRKQALEKTLEQLAGG